MPGKGSAAGMGVDGDQDVENGRQKEKAVWKGYGRVLGEKPEKRRRVNGESAWDGDVDGKERRR